MTVNCNILEIARPTMLVIDGSFGLILSNTYLTSYLRSEVITKKKEPRHLQASDPTRHKLIPCDILNKRTRNRCRRVNTQIIRNKCRCVSRCI
jgi:hypothetical protein